MSLRTILVAVASPVVSPVSPQWRVSRRLSESSRRIFLPRKSWEINETKIAKSVTDKVLFMTSLADAETQSVVEAHFKCNARLAITIGNMEMMTVMMIQKLFKQLMLWIMLRATQTHLDGLESTLDVITHPGIRNRFLERRIDIKRRLFRIDAEYRAIARSRDIWRVI